MDNTVNSSTFKIRGMTCQGCANTIQEGLSTNSDIDSAKVVLETNELTITSNQQMSVQQVDSRKEIQRRIIIRWTCEQVNLSARGELKGKKIKPLNPSDHKSILSGEQT